MERLTKRLPDGKVVTDCDSCEQKKDKQCTFSECRASFIKRLASYEDIAELCGGFDRLRELAEADKDGRVVVLPCRQGDELWTYGNFTRGREVYRFTVSDVSTLNGRTVLNTLGLGTIRQDDIGKTVFSTREEAERAMQEMEGKA